MSQKEIIVQGATCQCQFGSTTDKLKVLTQQKHYVNDKDGAQKLIASHVDIGMTFEKNTFGQCKLQPTPGGFKPCMPALTEWKGMYKDMVLINNGQVLVEDSKGVCTISGSPCILFTKTGQKGQPSQQNIDNADEEQQSQINPLVNMKELDKADFYEFLNTE
ncbi:DUF4280 domain-containing protein [Pedobacter fastidiosus]|uniref:DUF4280 domain-containing protein n=1 Tax=Pedobacter fastidiosus TaxID=2765361 RepID=A0ABR7KXA9_9SPHI|nr:DUF4280 domain-containing protein [Pedobacter fastidiosus]MBC6112712.1 DUF4280 domain-containing protein [Pedobacter fastidiosus]